MKLQQSVWSFEISSALAADLQELLYAITRIDGIIREEFPSSKERGEMYDSLIETTKEALLTFYQGVFQDLGDCVQTGNYRFIVLQLGKTKDFCDMTRAKIVELGLRFGIQITFGGK